MLGCMECHKTCRLGCKGITTPLVHINKDDWDGVVADNIVNVTKNDTKLAEAKIAWDQIFLMHDTKNRGVKNKKYMIYITTVFSIYSSTTFDTLLACQIQPIGSKVFHYWLSPPAPLTSMLQKPGLARKRAFTTSTFSIDSFLATFKIACSISKSPSIGLAMYIATGCLEAKSRTDALRPCCRVMCNGI